MLCGPPVPLSAGRSQLNTTQLESPPHDGEFSPNGLDAGVLLADGTRRMLGDLGPEQLTVLRWEQEQAFARQILASPKGSRQRAEVTCQAYDTVTSLLAAAAGGHDVPLVMGMHPRQGRLVLDLLARQRRRGIEPSLFEIGYGVGLLLERVFQAGYRVGGIEVSTAMHEEACRRLGPGRAGQLHLGDFLRHDVSDPKTPPTLVYWNDVFEHVAPDEILDYLVRIREILAPAGQLVTITPNWHMRPADVTACFHPPRTEAAGLHLKEYTLREVTSLLYRAGFDRVDCPLVVTPGRLLLAGGGMARSKRLFEPCLERLPYPLASLLCRGLALNCTIASKGGR